ncbi:MAG: hypothetical protein ACPG3X_08490 [Opitutales bacterium]
MAQPSGGLPKIGDKAYLLGLHTPENKLLIEVLLANLPACIELITAGNSLVEISFGGAV